MVEYYKWYKFAIGIYRSTVGIYKSTVGMMLLLILIGNANAGINDIKLSLQGEDGGDYHIVKFSDAISDEWKKDLESSGVNIIAYIPENSLLIKYHGVLDLPSIVSFENFSPEYKVSSRLKEMKEYTKGDITINVIPFDNNNSLISQISLLGGKVEPTSDMLRLRVTIDASRIQDIASIEDVKWVEEYVPPKLLNDVATNIIGVSTVWTDTGLNGTGQVVAIDDSGLDTGDMATIHDDFKGRIKAHFGYGRPSIGSDPGQTKTWNDPIGHGTHASGSILGNGIRSGGKIKGMAYNATLVFQSIIDSNNDLGGLNVGINKIYLDSYNQGAMIQSGSWGSRVNGAYDSYSADVDTFTWNHKDFVILFAAGNYGEDSNSDGIVDLDSLTSPGTAKNVITVGSSENVRSSGGLNQGGFCYTWGSCWQFYPAYPIYNDRISDNSNGIAAFSGRGPTDDGRIKPDVVAPGTNILSTKSSIAPDYNYWGILDSSYAYNGGTSMSTPLVAGVVALVRQYYVDNGTSPNSALIKATLINMAKNMTGQYASPNNDIIGQPDNNQGWGRVDLNRLKEKKVFVDNTIGLSTGKFNRTNVIVNSSQMFIATLVWTDYPGSLGAQKALVNDLDMIIIDPNGQEFYGNDFTIPYNSSNDSINNVEGVIINNPIDGDYKVNVLARNVPMGPQPFALVISGIGGNITTNTTIYPGKAIITSKKVQNYKESIK